MKFFDKMKLKSKLKEADILYCEGSINMESEDESEVSIANIQLEESLSICEEILLNDQLNIEAKIIKSNIFIEQNKYTEAKDLINFVLSREPKNIDALCSIAQIHIFNDEFDKATEYLKQGMQIDNSSFEVVEKLISMNLYLGNHDEAIKYIDMIISGPARKNASKLYINLIKEKKLELLSK
jgi:tetratricopeptide (TPR) repeat protein